MKTKWTMCALTVLSLGVAGTPVRGQPADTFITYQGMLRQNGVPVDGATNLRFERFNERNEPVSQWDAANVPVDKGLFTAQINFGADAFRGPRSLQVSILGPGPGEVTPILPRQPLTATPYALQTRGMFVDDEKRVGIGTISPHVALHVASGSDVTPAEGGVIEAGSFFSNVTLDDNEIMARSNGAPSGLFLNHEGADVLVSAASTAGSLGVGTIDPLAGVHIRREPFEFGGTLALEGDTHAYMSFFPQGVGNGRKAWFGFGGPNTPDLSVVNDAGGAIGFWTDEGLRAWIDVLGRFHLTPPLPFFDGGNMQWLASDGLVGYDTSSRRYKENITPLRDDFERLLDAQAMTYTRPGNPNRWEIGYIAEDLADLGLTHLLQYDPEGRPLTVNYEKSLLYVVEIAKKQRAQLARQQSDLAAAEHALASLNGRVSELERRLSASSH